ncbi:hypothetical protein WN48_01155 [Eufriesea mexicana]|nr:hypothetical protein WN48_01155 [Eufriesea mexicana]
MIYESEFLESRAPSTIFETNLDRDLAKVSSRFWVDSERYSEKNSTSQASLTDERDEADSVRKEEEQDDEVRQCDQPSSGKEMRIFRSSDFVDPTGQINAIDTSDVRSSCVT